MPPVVQIRPESVIADKVDIKSPRLGGLFCFRLGIDPCVWYGLYNFILAQPKEKLMRFREALKKTDYYSYWSEDYYKEIVGD